MNRVFPIVKTLLPLASALALSVAGCTNSHGHAPMPVPAQQSASPVVMVVDYGIGAGDKRVEPTAFRGVASGRCLAWHDLFSRGAAIYEVHLRVPAAQVVRTKRAIKMLVRHPEINVAGEAAFVDPPARMGRQSPLNC